LIFKARDNLAILARTWNSWSTEVMHFVVDWYYRYRYAVCQR